MATLALSKDFLDRYHKLEPRARSKVNEHADTFSRLTAQQLRELKGLHLERYKNSADPRARTIRIDDNHRGIVMDVGNDEHFILTMIGTHDETDRWMDTNQFKVNAATGALEVLNVTAIAAAVNEIVPDTAAAALFEHRKDKDFTQLGIDENLIPALRAFTNDDQLEALLHVLPEVQMSALIQLTDDQSVETIYADIAGAITPGEIDTEDLVAALEAPASRSLFRIVEDQDELASILSQPLAQWRVFLHPSQREMAYKETYNGPARVSGGAGTGKTVVAMHRAKALAERLDDRSGKPILFTTYTRNLAQAIEADLRQLGGSDLLDVVEVANIDRIVYRVVQDAEGSNPKLAFDDVQTQCWDDVIDEEGLEYSREFLHNEWEQVVLAQGCRSRSDYFQASRAGRGVPLDRRARAAVWKAVESFLQKLSDRKVRTYLQLADDAAGYLRSRSLKPYVHVVVDEAQDLHEAQWRLIRALADAAPNDLFLAGDTHQRIYDRRSSLSRVGINIRGRSRKLKINYRTTHEILAWSMTLLGEGHFTFDDLDDGTDAQTFAGYHSYRRGPVPTLSGHKSKKQQVDALVEQVKRWVDDGVAPESIGIAGRTNGLLDVPEAGLEAVGVPTCRLPQKDLPDKIGVRIGSMHRMKGLEFERVAIFDADDSTIPLPISLTDKAADATQHQLDLQRECCLLYVAATRARDDLWIGWSGKPSRFLGPMLDDR
jgi:hypothetical protein